MYSKKMIPFATFCLLSPMSQAKEPALYSTSFENFSTKKVSEFIDGGILWKLNGGSTGTKVISRTGKKSLLFDAKESSAEVLFNGKLKNCRGVTFWASHPSRITGAFQFRAHAKVDNSWKEIEVLDTKIAYSNQFLSEINIALPKLASAFKLSYKSWRGAVYIDDFKLLKDPPTRSHQTPMVATETITHFLENKELFKSGSQGTHTFRIPTLITARNGDLIAAVDARRQSGSDLKLSKDIDIVIRRSSDNGKTWTDIETIIDHGPSKTAKPTSDSSFILDRTTGEIFCFYNYMDQIKSPKETRFHVQSSTDHGKTWGAPRDITDSITKPEWKMNFKFITSGRGIQTNDGELLHTLVNLETTGLFLFGSKDHGKTWRFNDVVIKPGNESKVIQLSDGSLMVNSRLGGQKGKGFRGVHRSSDGGKTWSFSVDKSQIDPVCNGSILRYTKKADGYSKDRLLLCHPNSFSGRNNLTIKISYDEGKTWSRGKVIEKGPSAYSSLTICKDGSIGVLYEIKKNVNFARFTLEEITDGKDKLKKAYKY